MQKKSEKTETHAFFFANRYSYTKQRHLNIVKCEGGPEKAAKATSRAQAG